jgi:hypothetical protein
MDQEKCECAWRRANEIAQHRREVEAWARDVKRLSGSTRGFVAGPTYPVLKAFEPGCGPRCLAVLELLETH